MQFVYFTVASSDFVLEVNKDSLQRRSYVWDISSRVEKTVHS